MKTRFEIIIDHRSPLDPEKYGERISQRIHLIGDTLPFKGNVIKTETLILDYNKPDDILTSKK